MSEMLQDFFKVCVKIYGPEPVGLGDDAAAFVPVFHEWIRDGGTDLVLFDVADYAHAPDSPGIVLVTHEAHFALDRSDGRFGLLAQRRTPVAGGAVEAVATTLRHALQIASRLERDPRLAGKLRFDTSRVRVESNDRLRAPNATAGHEAFAPVVRKAAEMVFRDGVHRVERVANDPRDRLALDLEVDAASVLLEPAASAS
jgi:hypothetical protein